MIWGLCEPAVGDDGFGHKVAAEGEGGARENARENDVRQWATCCALEEEHVVQDADARLHQRVVGDHHVAHLGFRV